MPKKLMKLQLHSPRNLVGAPSFAILHIQALLVFPVVTCTQPSGNLLTIQQ